MRLPILTRYILRVHVGPFLFALAVLTGVLMVNTVARRLETLAGKGLPWSVTAEVFLLSMPHILALTLPMAVLVSTLYAFSQLAADNEITALKASGVNLASLLKPLVVAAVAFAAGMLWFNDYLLPETNHRLKLLLLDVGRTSPTLELKEQAINNIRTQDARTRYYLHPAEVDPATNRMRDVVIYDLSSPQRGRTVYAERGEMAFSRDRTDLYLTLHDGWIHEQDRQAPERFVRTFFEDYEIRVAGVGTALERTDSSGYRTDREMSLGMLKAEADAAREEIAQVRDSAAAAVRRSVEQALLGPADEIGRGGPGLRRAPELDELTRGVQAELRSANARLNALRHRINIHEVEYYKKYAISFAAIVFVLIGAPIAVRFPRGGVGMVIAVSVGTFAVHYAGLIGGEQLADADVLSPAVAMWAPNLIFLALGLWGLARIGREVSTTRGGGWDDLLDTLKSLLARPVRALRGGTA